MKPTILKELLTKKEKGKKDIKNLNGLQNFMRL
jgi:hypothetical protein